MKIKKVNEMDGLDQIKDMNKVKDVASEFRSFARYTGVDSKWLIEYIIECFEYNLDIETTPFSEEELDNIIHNMKKINENI